MSCASYSSAVLAAKAIAAIESLENDASHMRRKLDRIREMLSMRFPGEPHADLEDLIRRLIEVPLVQAGKIPVLDRPIEKEEWSVRACTAFEARFGRDPLPTIGQIRAVPPGEWMKQRNVGRSTVREILNMLAIKGVPL